jgi:hypothetical protein
MRGIADTVVGIFGSLFQGKSGQNMTLTTLPHLAPRLKKE